MVGITPSPATDWRQTKTYENKRFGFSFQYDPTRFRIKEVEQGPNGGFTVYVADVEDVQGSSLLWIYMAGRPAYMAEPNPTPKQLRRMGAQYAASQAGLPGATFSDPRLVFLGGMASVVLDATIPPGESRPWPQHHRVYLVPARRVVDEVGVLSPEATWSAEWSRYEGVVASFRAD